MLLSVPQRGHLIDRQVNWASASFLLQCLQRIVCIANSRDSLAPLCAQHGALAKRRKHLQEVFIGSVSALPMGAPSLFLHA